MNAIRGQGYKNINGPQLVENQEMEGQEHGTENFMGKYFFIHRLRLLTKLPVKGGTLDKLINADAVQSL